MAEYRNQAAEILNRLHQESHIDHLDYLGIMDGLCEIETLRDRDEMLEALWEQFTDVPINPETECLEEEFLDWPAGTHREEIWHWFDRRYSRGVAHLLYGFDGVDRTDQIAKLLYLKQFCDTCDSCDCLYNHKGVCRFALVHERKPRVHDAYGCLDSSYEEGFGK